jgi:transposase
MAEQERMKVLTDAQWDQLAPLIEACRPHGKTEPQDLRRTIEAIIWRHENGAKWRSIPAELGAWWIAAQMFNRWGHMGVWERLLDLAQQRGGLKMGMTFLDGTTIRAHQKAAGAAKKGGLQRSVTSGRRSAVRVAVSAARPA